MRSLIILEVEHGEDTCRLESMISHVRAEYGTHMATVYPGRPVVKGYTVRVDLPECFVLDSGETERFDYRPTHVSVSDGSDAMALGYDDDDNLLMLVNEDGYRWTDPTEQWRPI